MSHPIIRAVSSPRVAHLIASGGVLLAAVLCAPLTATADPMTTHRHHAHHHAMSAESVEQRITSLHARLEITPTEEANWAPVAQAMRDNEAHMQSMVAARAAEPAHDVSAVEDMKIYERFNQAHVDGLKALISSFEVLYTAMPDDQKHLADRVFHHFGHRDRSHA